MGNYRLIDREKNGALKTEDSAAVDKTEITDLIAEAMRGNRVAFGEVYGIYLDRIYRYILYQVNDIMAAEDLTEEVFVKAWKAMPYYRGKGSQFSAWLYRIAHNQVMDDFRNRKDHLAVSIDSVLDMAEPGRMFTEGLTRREVLELVSRLPEQQRQIIILKFIEGLDNQEIMEITGQSQGAIRIMQMRALSSLRRELCGVS